MLQSLKKLDRSRAASVLSLAARKFLPRPTDDHSSNQDDQDAAANLIEELSAKASSRRPQAEVDTIAVQEALSREISSYLLSEVDSSEVRARVGDKGALSPSLYKVTFSPRFTTLQALWGVSKNHVLDAIANCDNFQHFVYRMAAPNAPPHGSLFTKIPLVKRDNYTILVKCQRMGDILVVDDAYRVYHDDVYLIGAIYPIDILKRFLDTFGMDTEIMILNADGTNAQPPERAKLFHDAVYDVPNGGMFVHKFSGETVRIGPVVEARQLEVALSYDVSSPKYADQLMRHGVKVQIPTQRAPAFRVL